MRTEGFGKRLLAGLMTACMLATSMPVFAEEQAPSVEAEIVETSLPTDVPQEQPKEEATAAPTPEPTAAPTPEPTAAPTEEPTAEPVTEPTAAPAEEPTAEPVTEPTATPLPEETSTAEPSEAPTETPLVTEEPLTADGSSAERALSLALSESASITLLPGQTVYYQFETTRKAEYRMDFTAAFDVNVELLNEDQSSAGSFGTNREKDDVTYIASLKKERTYYLVLSAAEPDAQGDVTLCVTRIQEAAPTETPVPEQTAEPDPTETPAAEPMTEPAVGALTASEAAGQLSITRAIDVPTLTSATPNAQNGTVTVTWRALSAVDGYALFYSTDEVNWNVVDQYNSNGTVSAIFTRAASGVKYFFKLHAFQRNGGVLTWGASSNVLVTIVMGSPTVNGFTQDSATSAKLSWTAMNGVDGYYIYLRDGTSGKWIAVPGGDVSSYSMTGLTTGLIYTAELYAYTGSGTSFTLSPAAAAITCPLLAAPVLTTPSSYGSGYTISWSAVANAQSYVLYRSLTPQGGYAPLYVGPATSYTDTTTAAGVKYYYCAVAGANNNRSVYGISMLSNVVTAYAIGTPTVSAAQTVVNQAPAIEVTWTELVGVDGYEIVWYADGVYRNAIVTLAQAQADGRAYTITPVSQSTSTIVYVRGYVTQVAGGNSVGPLSVPVTCIVLSQPTITNCLQLTDTSYQLSWSAVANAKTYVIYRRTNGGEFGVLAEVSGTTYTDTALNKANLYTYAVRACANQSGRPFYGPMSEEISAFAGVAPAFARVEQVTGSDGSPAVHMKWNAVDNVDGYEVSWIINGATKHDEVAASTNDYILLRSQDAAVVTGNAILAKVRTYRTVNGVKYYGAYSAAATITLMTAPVIAAVSPDSGSMTLTVSWGVVAGSQGYYLYRSTNELDGYALIAYCPSNSYVDRGVQGNITYYYRVMAFNKPVAGVESYSPKSDAKSGYLFAKPTLTGVEQVGADSMKVSFGQATIADGYEISWSMLTTSDVKTLTAAQAQAQGYSVEFANLAPNRTYSVRVRIYTEDSQGHKTYSEYSTSTNLNLLAAPAITSCGYSAATRNVVLTWSGVSGAKGYVVMRSTTGTNPTDFVNYAVTTNTSFTNYSLPTGSVYYYKILAYDYVTVTSATQGTAVGMYSYSQPSGIAFAASPIAVRSIEQFADPTDTTQPAMWVRWAESTAYDGYTVSWTVNGVTRTQDVVAPTTEFVISHTLDVNVTTGRNLAVRLRGYVNDPSGVPTYSDYGDTTYAYILEAPTAITATPTTGPANWVTWSPVANASGYSLYRYDALGNAIPIASVSSTSYRDTGVNANQLYMYSVVAWTLPAGTSVYSFSQKSPIAVSLVAGTPTMTTLTQGERPLSASVAWVKVDNAAGYIISCTKAGGEEKTYDVPEATAAAGNYMYTISNLDVDSTYSVKVRAYITYAHPVTGADTLLYGNYSNSASINILASPMFGSCTTDSEKRTNHLSWTASIGASGYRLERSTQADGPYQVMAYVAGTSFQDSTIAANQTYYYRLAAYCYVRVDGIEFASMSPWTISVPMTAVGAPTVSSIATVSNTSLRITWQPVSGITGYQVTWADVTTPTVTQSYMATEAQAAAAAYTYAIPNLTAGKRYILKIRCYVEENNVTTYSIYTKDYTVPLLEAPTLSGTAGTSSCSLTVTEVTNRTYYRFQRSINGVTWDNLDNSSTLNFLDKYSIERGRTYYYRACAFVQYDTVGGVAQYLFGNYSNVITLTPTGSNYRALLIGNSDYEGTMTDLNGPKSDVANFNTMLNTMYMSDGGAYATTRLLDQTGSQILSAISSAFANAEEGDISLFYYSGHGASNGAIVGVNTSTSSAAVSPAQLRAKFDTIPGTIVIMLDSCYSGGGIAKDASSAVSVISSQSEAQSMVSNFINAMTTGVTKSGELRASKYKVLVSSSYNETSNEYSYYDPASGSYIYYGLFTRQLLRGCGYDLITKSYVALLADQHGDRKLTLDELYQYVSSNVNSGTQTCQVYPENDSTVIFEQYIN